jgi:cytochrome c peroxidase
MTRVRRVVVIGLGAALLCLATTIEYQGSDSADSAASEAYDPMAEIRGSKVKDLYDSWASRQDSAGGDSNVMVALGRARNHTTEARNASGSVKLDMTSGKITAHVSGLEPNDYDLWLVDNIVEGSALPDPGDRMVNVGELQRTGGDATLSAQIDTAMFDRFQTDMVVVARRGEQPGDNSVLFGSLSLFQRLYSALGSPARLLASDFASSAKRGPRGEGSFLSVRSAYADNIFVDADVVFRNLVRQGAELFINGTFSGNGRTCATCHPATNNVTLDVATIADLPDDDPLFVAEFIPELAQNFENPVLMRGAALILETLDGFEDPRRFVMRSIPHVLALSTSILNTNIPFDNTAPPNSNFPPGFPAQRTGWAGDGSPNSGSLRDFATGAVTQHFTITMGRRNGQDFILPTAAQLDAMEAFQLALGRQAEVNTAALKLRDPRARLGRDIFNRLDTGNPPKPTVSVRPNTLPQGPPLPAGKCALCHFNAGANLNTTAFVQLFASIGQPVPTVVGNGNFATGINDLRSPPAAILDPTRNPRDGGFGRIPHDGVTRLPQIGNVPCAGGRGGFGVVTLPGGVLPPGLCEEDFNTPPIIEAADTPPFFHNNAVNTIEAAVAFYNDDALNNSVGGQLLKVLDTNGVGIRIDTTQVTAIASFLRVLNALENIRQVRETLNGAIQAIGRVGTADIRTLINNAQADTDDAIDVLTDGQLHPRAVRRLKEAALVLSLPDNILQMAVANALMVQAQRDIVDP